MNKKVRPQYQGAEAITALIYLCSMSAALMYVLCRQQALACTIIMTAVSFGIYMLFYAFRKKRAFAVMAFAATAISSAILIGVVFNQSSSSLFIDFIFKNSETFDILFAGTAIFIFSCIFGFSTCYFSVYLPRPSFLLLPALIPMILSARTAGGLPAGFTVFLAVGFGLAVLGSARPEFPKDIVYIDDKSSRKERIASIAVFGVISALLLTVIPRSADTPMGDYLDTVFNKKSTFYGRNTLSNFSKSSSVNTGANKPSDNVLFYASSYYFPLLGRWSFDKYDGENGWTTLSDYTTGWGGWEETQMSLDVNALAEKLKEGARNGNLSEYADELLALNTGYSRQANMTISVADGTNTRVIIHPNNTHMVYIPGYSGDIYRTRKDEIFTDGNFGANASYSIQFTYFSPNTSLISLFDRVDFDELLDAAEDEGVISRTLRDNFITERNIARNYLSRTLEENPISPEITALADKITAGITSDYEKARAIEKWFGEAGFVYDLDFIPEKMTADYFLFESRRGICSDYATATTLLLRAAGIPARYTEGFVPDSENIDEYGRCAVKPANAHAYSMCYIEGHGWLEIDGTKYAREANSNEQFTSLALIILISTAGAAILAIVFRKPISEAAFAVSLLFGGNDGKIRRIYLRTRRLACSISGIEPESAAAGEVGAIIKRSLGLTKEADEITQSADMLLYGGKSPEISAKRLYKDYRIIRRTKRKMKK